MENMGAAEDESVEPGDPGRSGMPVCRRMPSLDWKFAPLAFYPLAYNSPLIGISAMWGLLPAFFYFLNRSRIKSMTIPLSIAGFVGLLALNTAFNDVPQGSSYMVPLLVSALVSGVIVGGLPSEQSGNAFWTMLALPTLVSALLIAAGVGRAPLRRVAADVEGWRGAFEHKNSLGLAAGLLLLLALYRPAGRIVNKGWIVGVGGLLIATRSSSAILSCVFALSLTQLYRGARRRGWRRLGSARLLLVVAIVEVGLAYLLTSHILDLAGRDASLTGRTTIWAGLPGRIASHYIWGHGVGSFWVIGASAQDRDRIFEAIHFVPGQAHNGWLDIGLDLGVPGLLLMVGLLVIGIKHSVLPTTDEEWLLPSLLYLFALTIAERGIYSVMGLFYIAFAAVRATSSGSSSTRWVTPRSTVIVNKR